MANRLAQVIAGLILFLVVARAAGGQEEITLGIYPYRSPSQTVEHYAPLRKLVAQSVARPVDMVSAPDVPMFVERLMAGDYDMVFTAPHVGRLAELRSGWRAVTQTALPMEIVVLVSAGSSIKTLKDLRDKTIAVGGRESIAYQSVDRALNRYRLALERNVKVVETLSFSNVVPALLHGEVDAGAITERLWRLLPATDRGRVRVVFRAPPLPGFLLMAHPRFGETDIERLRKALLEFKNTAEGRDFFEKTQLVGFRQVDRTQMRRLDAYTGALMRRQ